MNDILDTIRDGVGVNIRVDPATSALLGATLFIALVLALTVYAKVLK